MFSALLPAVVTAEGASIAHVLADDGLILLGDDFMPWLVLAFGAAMVVGNVLALVRPPTPRADEDPAAADTPARPPFARASIMIGIGAIAAIWGIASLLN